MIRIKHIFTCDGCPTEYEEVYETQSGVVAPTPLIKEDWIVLPSGETYCPKQHSIAATNKEGTIEAAAASIEAAAALVVKAETADKEATA